MNLPRIIFALLLVFLLSPAVNAEKDSLLPKEHVLKLRRIAEIISGEIKKTGVKTVVVSDFTDFKGNPSAKGSAMSKELRLQLASIGGNKFKIVNAGAEAVVTGTLIPFKESGKWKLDIMVFSPDKGKAVLSYTGIFKKPKNKK